MRKPKRKQKKQRVPQILWRLYRSRARTLSQTIITLFQHSTSSSSCYCKTRYSSSCLACSDDAFSFLVRPRDPHDYKMLLTHCFVVVTHHAPSFNHFSPLSRWSQQQIVAKTVELMQCEDKKCSNVLCNGYDQPKGSGSNMDLLTTSAWSLLLNRVGDALMIYLLRYTSIFLPLPHNSHQQVTGYPIGKLCFELQKHSVEVRQPLQGHGSHKKSNGVHSINSVLDGKQSHQSLYGDVPSNFVGCLGCIHASNLKLNTRHHREEFCLESSSEMVSTSGTMTIDVKTDLNGKFYSSPVQEITSSKKRRRPFKWQRDRKCRRVICNTTSNGNGILTEMLLHDLKPSVSLEKKVPLTCSCCLIVLSPDPSVKRVHIDRKHMFYNSEQCSSAFPGTNIFNTLMPNSSSANILFENIFGKAAVTASIQSCVHSSNFCLIGSACLYHSVLKLIKILIRRAKCCDFIKLLDKHCGVTLSDLHCSQNQVVSFIWAACRSIIPADMLGNTHNRRTLRRNIFKFIQLRRFEKVSIKQCLHNLKSSGFPFLSNKHSFCYRTDQIVTNVGESITMNDNAHIMKCRILEKWVFWLFSFLIVSVVQVNFYVTESQHGKQSVLYFKKSVWDKIINRAISQLGNESYRQLDDPSVRNILDPRPFGFSKLRFLPKEKGVRMLANLTAPSRLPLQLSSLDGNRNVLHRRGHLHPRPVKYKYFKSVNSVLREAHAILNGLRFREPDKLGSSVFDYNDVYKKLCPFLMGLRNILPSPSVYIVVADVSKAFDSVDQDKLFSIMKDVLGKNQYVLRQSLQVVKRKKSLWVDRKLVLFDENLSTTFPSHTSSVPCSSHSILVNQKQASSFFNRLQRGFKDYNCCMNKEKFGLNFDTGNIKGLLTDRIFVGGDGISFLQWSGLLINCCTSEVQADYTRYSSKHIRSTFTVRWQGEPGHNFKEKLCAFMRPRCHPIFFDSNINSAAIVRLNIYQAFLLCAMKFHCYFRDLSDVCKLRKGCYLHIITESMRYMCGLINKRMRSVNLNDYRPVLHLEDGEVEWLGLTAYVKVLKRKQSRHKDLLSLLKFHLATHQITGMVSPSLEYATESIHSSSIWSIHY